MKRQKIMSLMKGQGKTPEKQVKEVERIQNNGSKDNPRSQEKNGGEDWEDARNVYQRPTRTKEQIEINNTLEGIQSRITKAEEQINDLEDRMVEITTMEQIIEKKEWKEMRT